VVGQVALAEPAAITAAKSEAAALQERVDELSHLLDAAVEDYNYAKAKLADTQAAMETTQAQLSKAEGDLGVATALLTQRLVEIYKQGQLGVLDTLVGSTSFSELINRLDLMERLSEQDAKTVEEVQAYQEDVTARKAQLAQQMEDEKLLSATGEGRGHPPGEAGRGSQEESRRSEEEGGSGGCRQGISQVPNRAGQFQHIEGCERLRA
jgi:peptidoglycan hydrolase CwlO-like protein